jgi:hypothetical protein
MKKILWILLLMVGVGKATAQSDPTLAGLILIYTNKAESELNSQKKVMALQTTGHLWMQEEVNATTDFQKLYNDYLDTFRDIVCYAAQIYGFYHEIGKLTDNMGDLTKQLKAHPDGAVASVLLPNRNYIYEDLLVETLEIVNDIREVCLSSVKMTEKQRAEIIFGIRPKLKKINRTLHHLTLAVKYSSLSEVWHEIEDGTTSGSANKARITQAAMERWRRKARDVK